MTPLFTQHYIFIKHAVERLYERTGGSDEAKAVLSTVKKHLQRTQIKQLWCFFVAATDTQQHFPATVTAIPKATLCQFASERIMCLTRKHYASPLRNGTESN